MTVGRIEYEMSSAELSEWQALDTYREELKREEENNAARLAKIRERHMKQFGIDPVKG